jgi:hypothetical protein
MNSPDDRSKPEDFLPLENDDHWASREPNAEQRDEGQAHDVAAEALDGIGSDPTVDSEDGAPANPASLIPDDVPDLVDTMNQMVRSGRIDNGAFAGEPMHDDEEAVLGITDDDADLDEDGLEARDPDGM